MIDGACRREMLGRACGQSGKGLEKGTGNRALGQIVVGKRENHKHRHTTGTSPRRSSAADGSRLDI